MGEITLGQIASALGLIVAIIASLSTIIAICIKLIRKVISDELKDMKDDIKEIKEETSDIKLDAQKNFLIQCINHIEHNLPTSDTMKEKFYETSNEYLENGHNGYIKAKIEELKRKGLI